MYDSLDLGDGHGYTISEQCGKIRNAGGGDIAACALCGPEARSEVEQPLHSRVRLQRPQ